MLVVSLFVCLPVSAGVISYTDTGTFAFDNDVVLFDLHLLTPAHVVIYTSSYAAGGFEPHLELFDETGTVQLGLNNSGSPACVPNGPAPVHPERGRGDAEIHAGPSITDELASGHYIVALPQINNYADSFDVFGTFIYDGPGNQNYTARPGVCDNYRRRVQILCG